MTPSETTLGVLRKELEGTNAALLLVRERDALGIEITPMGQRLGPGIQERLLNKRNELIVAIAWVESKE